MRTIGWLILSLLLAASRLQTPAPTADPVATPPNSKVWIGHYEEYEKFLLTAEIDQVKDFKTGVTGHTKHVFFKPGGLAPEGAMRDQAPGRYEGYFESYQHEAAAYKMDRLLQLDMVPPTVERMYDRKKITLQLVVLNVKMLKEVNEKRLHAPDPERWNYQLHRAYVFDDLVGNIDENAGNMMFDPEWNFIKVDCSRCFTDTRAQPFEIGKRFMQIDRPFFDRVKALDKDTVKREIGNLVQGGTVEALFGRRDDIVKAFEKLAKQKGQDAVFVP